MSVPTSRLSYLDCYPILDKALDEERGVRVHMGSYEAASQMRMRLHLARKIDREANTQTYEEPDHPMHGRSQYDKVVVRIRNISGSFWLYIEKRQIDPRAIEPIPEGDETFLLERLEPAPEPEDANFEEVEQPKQIPDLRRV